MKLTFVTPRYGTEVVGGAERAALMLAERVHAQLGWDVEAVTSCALEADSWANHYPAGDAEINGVHVRRFPVSAPRAREFPKLSRKVHANPRMASRADQELWIDQQGPTAPGILDALSESDADVFAFYPYLYYPTVKGLPRVSNRAIMHPAAHDESSIRMSIFGEVFGKSQAFVFQTNSERRLVERLFPIAHRPQLLLGLGIETHQGDKAAFRHDYGLGDRPYVVCLGRVDEAKGSRLLAEYFVAYKRRHPGPLALVFIGPVVEPLSRQSPGLDRRDDIIVTGVVSEATKWGALRDAEVLVSPSPFEAFALVLLEGWAAGKAAMVNASCLPTREHCETSKGGIWFDGYLSFETGLAKLLADGGLRERMALAGQRYVEDHFAWPALVERYGTFIERVVERSTRAMRAAS